MSEKDGNIERKVTRKKNIDFSRLGQRMTMSNNACHKCKNVIPLNDEHKCRGTAGKGSQSKGFSGCDRFFCKDCLNRYFPE